MPTLLQVWATSSTAPVPASLGELCAEPHLLPALQACLEGATLSASEQQLFAARAALEVAEVLLVDPELRAALLSAAGEAGSGALRALGTAVRDASWPEGDCGVEDLARTVVEVVEEATASAMDTD